MLQNQFDRMFRIFSLEIAVIHRVKTCRDIGIVGFNPAIWAPDGIAKSLANHGLS